MASSGVFKVWVFESGSLPSSVILLRFGFPSNSSCAIPGLHDHTAFDTVYLQCYTRNCNSQCPVLDPRPNKGHVSLHRTATDCEEEPFVCLPTAGPWSIRDLSFHVISRWLQTDLSLLRRVPLKSSASGLRAFFPAADRRHRVWPYATATPLYRKRRTKGAIPVSETRTFSTLRAQGVASHSTVAC